MPESLVTSGAAAPLLALLVSADAAAVRRLRGLIAPHRRLRVVGAARDVAQAIARIAADRPDVVFLDAAMEDGAGMRVARHAGDGQAVVIVTDRPEHACAAFECGVIDYLVAPVTSERFAVAVRRLDRRFPVPAPAPGMVAPAARLAITDHLALPAGRHAGRKVTTLVPVADLIRVESLQNYSTVHLAGGEQRMLKRTLTEWTSLLPHPEFTRIGRCHLIQVAKVRSIAAPGRNELVVHFHDAPDPLHLGRAAAGKLKESLRGPRPA